MLPGAPCIPGSQKAPIRRAELAQDRTRTSRGRDVRWGHGNRQKLAASGASCSLRAPARMMNRSFGGRSRWPFVAGQWPKQRLFLRHGMNKVARGSLLGIEQLDAAEILKILKFARRMNPQKPRPLLRGKRIILLFYEPSTRTRSSFEIAAKSMGAMTTLVHASGSSIEKGESLLDTAYTLRAVGADVIVIRHPMSGAPQLMAEHLDIPVVNAGDGMHEHPSQALLDAYTILKHKKTFKGLRVAIVGDIFHSRVACSACHLLTRLGAKVMLCGPPELVPDVATKLARRDAIVMHPGPIIRGMELTGEVADGAQSVIVDEVRNGVPTRMAILARAAGKAK